MSSLWKCDICGKETLIDPPFEYVEGKTAIARRQNPSTGEIEDVQIPAIKDLFPRTYIVGLSINHESISKDFCEECLKKHFMPEIKSLWKKLEDIKGK